MNVSIFPDINQITTPPIKVPIEVILGRISSGEGGLANLIEKLRQTAPENRRGLKKQLGCIIFSGYCGKGIEKQSKSTGRNYISYRNDKSLTEHSGLCVVDLDHLGDGLKVAEWKEEFSQLESVYAVFVSPSGNGLKVLFRIPAKIHLHRGHYRSILTSIRNTYPELNNDRNLDKTSINETRVCFISYDPDIYINPDAVEWSDYEEAEEFDVNDDAAIKQGNGLTDYSKMQIAAKMIDFSKDGYKHNTLVKAAYLMGGFITAGYVDEQEARQMLRARIKAKNPTDLKGAYQTIEDGIREGKRKPIYEIEQLEHEFNVEVVKKELKDENRGYTFLVDRKQLDEKMMDYIINGSVLGKSIGLPELDDYFRLKENNFSVFLGHDNVGKSSLIWFFAVVAAAKHGWKWIIYSPENDNAKTKKQLIDFLIGKRAEEASMTQIEMAKAIVDEHFYFIRKDETYTVFDLLKFGKVMCDHDPQIKGFMLDPYNSLLLDYKGEGAGLSSYEYHMKAITHIRIFAEKHCSVYVNAHSTTDSRRAGKPNEDGLTKRPHKSEIDGGAMWSNRVDDFYVIHRHTKHNELWKYTELHVDKIKDTDTGGQITRGEDVVKLKLFNRADFVDDDNVSPLKEWRNLFFKKGTQTKMESILHDDSGDVPF